MEYALQLKESDVLTLPRAQVRALLRSGDGSAALLYLFLAEAGGEKKETEICAALHWSSADLSAAVERLRALGLLGETRKVEEPLSAPPERARTPYSRSDIAAALEQDASFAALRQAVGEKLCRLMTEKDDDMLLGLYSDLGLGADVIFFAGGSLRGAHRAALRPWPPAHYAPGGKRRLPLEAAGAGKRGAGGGIFEGLCPPAADYAADDGGAASGQPGSGEPRVHFFGTVDRMGVSA